MSYCEIITFVDGKPNHSVEFGNSWGGAAFVWSALFDQYLFDPEIPHHNWLSMAGNGDTTLWKLAERADLPLFERAVHAATFDYAIVGKEHFRLFAGHLREFLSRYRRKYPNSVCHLEAWAQFIETCEADAVGFYATSVGENLWDVYDTETETYRPYDLATDTQHFEVYDLVLEAA